MLRSEVPLNSSCRFTSSALSCSMALNRAVGYKAKTISNYHTYAVDNEAESLLHK